MIERYLNEQRHEENMISMNHDHEQKIRKLDNERHRDDLTHTENMDRQNKIFQLNMNM